MNLFYPAHDIALSKGIRHFTPPLVAQRLGEDLAALSPVWQPEGAAVPLPWGWNYNTRKQLITAGVDPQLLPSLDDLEELRRLSSRTTVIDILRHLKEAPLTRGACSDVLLPQACTTLETLQDAVAVCTEIHRNYLLKAPWSSSGRGLCWSRVMSREAVLRRGAAIVRDMGCVLLEPEYQKVQDLAMLFYADASGVRFVGYSMFETDAMGIYRNGLMMSNEAMEQRLTQWVSREVLLAVRQEYAERLLPELLARLAGRSYPIGYIGIDMMMCRNERGSVSLHPCVEMNLRCTMGVVARHLYDRLVAPESVGSYVIEHAANADELRHRVEEQRRQNPPQREGERCAHGYFTLTDITDDSQFAAAMLLQ